ncbi:hypothetical protein ACFL2R_03440 [Patescibacteria group bacterium]
MECLMNKLPNSTTLSERYTTKSSIPEIIKSYIKKSQILLWGCLLDNELIYFNFRF